MTKPINLDHGNTIQFTTEQLRVMRDLYLLGSSIRQLSRKFGISDGAVKGRLKTLNVEINPRGRRFLPIAIGIEKVIEMRQRSISWRYISEAAGIEIRTLQDAVKRYRLTAAPQ